MINEAFLVLDAIKKGQAPGHPRKDDWLEAFRTMRWTVETTAGPSLTDDGEKAHAAMRRERVRAG